MLPASEVDLVDRHESGPYGSIQLILRVRVALHGDVHRLIESVGRCNQPLLLPRAVHVHGQLDWEPRCRVNVELLDVLEQLLLSIAIDGFRESTRGIASLGT